MHTKTSFRWNARIALFVLSLTFSLQILYSAGIVTNPTEADLRAALAGGGVVTFDFDGTITLTNTLVITNDTTLDASGHLVTISGGGAVRVLLVQPPAKLVLNRLTVADGYKSGDLGGGLLNYGDTTIIDCTFSNNVVANGPVFGGAIDHEGSALRITGSTFINNRADVLGGALSSGYMNGGQGQIGVTNCTFFGNAGGAVYIGEPIANPAFFVNCTFLSNTNGAVRKSQLTDQGFPVTLINTIVAYSVGGSNCVGVADGGYNLSTDGSLTNPTTLSNVDPLLGSLTHNGGFTRTVGLLSGSPAIDGGDDAAAPSRDQRGVLRPIATKIDIGAFEGRVSLVSTSTVYFGSTNYVVGESQGIAVVQVERAGTSAGTVGVTVSATAGTADAGADFAATNIAINFAEGEMQKSVPITILDDATPETNETVTLNLADPVGTTLDFPSTAELTIMDDDVAYVLTNYTDADLRAAIEHGGLIKFPSDGTIVLTNPIALSQFAVLDASGHNVTLSGGDSIRLFDVDADGALTLINLTIANGHSQGVNGAEGDDGGGATGGGIRVNGGALNLVDCRVLTNSVAGGSGGNGNPNGSGGAALGGAIYLNNGTLNATNTEFAGNKTMGGAGGTNNTFGGPTGTGGRSGGSAIYNLGGSVTLDKCVFASNSAIGGRAPDSNTSNSGRSGEAAGGAFFNDGGTFVVSHCSFILNSASTPQPAGPSGGSGGTVSGGAIHNSAGSMTLTDAEFEGNHVLGGDARRHLGTAGHGQGGAICNFDTFNLVECAFQNNSANGGNNGVPAGNGAGGAIFNGGQMQIEKTLFRSNTTLAGAGYSGGLGEPVHGFAEGGAVFTSNSLSLIESTLDANAAQGAAGGLSSFGPFPGEAAFGGAIYNTAICNFTNNTITANIASGGAFGFSHPFPSSFSQGGDGFGGGIFNTNGSLMLVNITLEGNAATGGSGVPDGIGYGGGIVNTNGVATVLNTIIANSPSGSNSFGTLTDAGHNLSSDGSCNFSATGSLNNTDPKLGPLGDYGGPTPTIPLLAGSPAIDAADSANFPSTDQRGRSRPFGAAPDIGAFESSPPYVIRGQVSGFTLKDEVAVDAGLFNATTTNGRYSLEGLAADSYSIEPSHSNYVFLPSEQSIAVGPDQVSVNFKAYRWNALSLEDTSSNTLHLIYAGTNGQTHRVLASSNLVDWIAISTNVPGSSNLFEILEPMEERALFYQVQSP